MPWQWSPWPWVTITPSRRATSAASNCWRRSGPQSTSMRSPPLSTRIEVRRRQLRGSSGSHWPQWLPIFGTPVEVPQPRMRTLTPHSNLGRPGEQPEEVVRGGLGEPLGLLTPQLGDEGGGVGDEGGLALLSAMRNRREEGGIGFDQHLVRRQPFRGFLKLLGVLEGHDPGQRDV